MLPAGWFAGDLPECVVVPWDEPMPAAELPARMAALFAGDAAGFIDWLTARLPAAAHPFDRLIHTADLEALTELERD